jgi:predicted Zn-dependent peptidase
LGPKFEDVKRIARERFDKFRNHSGSKLVTLPSVRLKPLSSPRYHIHERPGIKQHHVAIGIPLDPKAVNDATLQVLCHILSFRLRRILREGNRSFDKGVYRVFAYISHSPFHKMIHFWFATKDYDFAKFGEEAILKECRKLKEELVDPVELSTMLSKANSTYYDTFRNRPGDLAELVIDSVCNGDEDLIELHSYQERLNKINRKRIRNAANVIFSNSYARVMIKPV